MKTLVTTILLLGAVLLPASKEVRNTVVHGLTVVASAAERFILRGDYSEIRSIDEDEFDDVIREPGRVVVVVIQKELSSRAKTRKLEKMLKELPSKVLIAKVRAERNPVLMARLKVSEIPTIHVYREGSLLGEFKGSISATEFKTFIDARLAERVSSGDGSVEMRPLRDDWLPPGVERE